VKDGRFVNYRGSYRKLRANAKSAMLAAIDTTSRDSSTAMRCS